MSGTVPVFPFCEKYQETPAHVLRDCTRAVWFSIAGFSSSHFTSFSDWIKNWFDDIHERKISTDENCKRTIIAWCLWKDRCDKVFHNVNRNPERTILKYHIFINDYLVQRRMTHNTATGVCRRNVHWSPPPMDVVSINVDGSFLNSNNTGGIGLIIRNFAGAQQAARCIFLMGIRNAEQAECTGLWEAVNWAKNLKLERVHFELDAKIVVEAVNNNASIDWQLLNMIKDIQVLFCSFNS
ncbi:uncharacterized protein LOC113360209 [Papaver somniferum]|uniref:uncharacterized protein LOC113360209 n=1 Tax=Papaver somniferum TaxID=3469 RepID=UPI000E6F8CBE|nr:uncharacterized protein LOC113360209 [Papaver somniferum]